MNKKAIYCFTMLILTLWPIHSFAVCPDPDTVTTVPKLYDVEVKARVTLDQITGIYSYFYNIKNGSQSTGCIWHFEVDIKKPEGGIDLPKEGLVNAPRFASLDIPDEDAPAMIPVTFPSLPKIGKIIIWGAGLTGRGEASWGSKRYIYEIMPGDTIRGLIMTTYGLPTIRDFEVEPEYIAEKEDIISKFGISKDELIADHWKYLNAFYESLAWKGKTLGPTAPPADFKPIDFLNYIISLKHEAYNLGWIKNAGIEQSLDAKLDNAKKKIEQGNIEAAKNILNAFINEVEAQGCVTYEDCSSGKHISPEAYALLKYNVQYLNNNLK